MKEEEEEKEEEENKKLYESALYFSSLHLILSSVFRNHSLLIQVMDIVLDLDSMAFVWKICNVYKMRNYV